MQNKKGNKNMEPVPKLKKRNSGTGSKINNKAFTLIELLVVITILAILATIGFLSFQSYNVFARDSVRLGNLKTLESSLGIQYVQSGNYALPDDSVNITASGTIIRKQGLFGKNALRTVGVSKNGSTDPLTQEYFDYSVGNNLQEYQLVAYLEGDEAMVSPHLASPKGRGIVGNSYANIGQMKSMGDDLGIVFSGGLELHKTTSNIGNDFDIRKAGDEYTVKFSEGDEITSSGSLLFSSIYNHSKNLLKNKELAKLDDSLVLYFDMETTTQSGGVDYLKDFSNYGNHGELMGGIKIGTEVGYNGKATYFDGDDDYIETNLELDKSVGTIFSSFDFTQDNTIGHIVHSGLGDGFGSQDEINLSISSAGELSFYVGSETTNGEYIFDNSIKISEDRNYGVGLTYKKNSSILLYLNGNLKVDRILGDLNPVLWNNVRIGRHYTSGGNIDRIFKGNMYEVRIYNRALSEEEIKNVYGSTLK